MGIFRKLTGDTQLHKLIGDLGIASADDKCHFAPLGKIMSISMCLQNFIKIFKTVQELRFFTNWLWMDTQGDYS